MTQRGQLSLLFAVTGFVGAVGASTFLWFFAGSENSYVVLGFKQPWLFAAFPFVGAFLAAAWSACFKITSFGAFHGALIALLSFFSFCAIVGGLGPAGLWGFIGFGFFGFVLFGWVLVLLGALAGRYFKRNLRGVL
jgi:hypothetical protein